VRESLDRFPSLINTILKQQVHQMVLHRPIESTALIGKVGCDTKESTERLTRSQPTVTTQGDFFSCAFLARGVNTLHPRRIRSTRSPKGRP
jgi:hypothetical protein